MMIIIIIRGDVMRLPFLGVMGDEQLRAHPCVRKIEN